MKMSYISDEIFEAYLDCKYKSYLKLQNYGGQKTDYENLQYRLDKKYREKVMEKLRRDYSGKETLCTIPLTPSILSKNKSIIFNTKAKIDGLKTSFDAVKQYSEKSNLYEPIKFCRFPKITSKYKMILAYKAIIMSRLQPDYQNKGIFIYGDNFSTGKVQLQSYMKKAEDIINELKNHMLVTKDVQFYLNPCCDTCEFSVRCKNKAIESDHLSLLRGISTKEINRHNQKGIFTVNQLSYTFRPRKKPKRSKKTSYAHFFSLQALSIRENKIHIHGTPEYKSTDTKAYFDIEGLPYRNMYYLIGLLITEKDRTMHRFFWADCINEQKRIFIQFLKYMKKFPDTPLYHFGNYEIIALRKMKKYLDEDFHQDIDSIIKRSVNVLSIVHSHIYFPTYSNSLKEIGRILGFKWTENDVSGIQSIIWREQWKENGDALMKEKLIQYNKEDCLALEVVENFIENLPSTQLKTNFKDEHFPGIMYTKELKKNSRRWPVWQRPNFVIKDLEHISNCAYFDYQRERVYVRTNKKFKRINKRLIKDRKINLKPDKSVEIQCDFCPHCGSRNIKKCYGQKLRRTQIDLKFLKNSIRKSIVRLKSWRYKCVKCSTKFVSSDWPRNRNIYGHGFIVWCIYQNVVCKQNLLQVKDSLKDLFGLSVNIRGLYNFRTLVSEYYESLYENILSEILKSPSINIDETTVNLRDCKGYVWVLTSLDKVYYLYRNSRKGDFLKELLEDFSGILISDFYSAYDSIKCAQQKCLLHLIRDMNIDLLNSPFNDEYKIMIKQFSLLLREIIDTIDRFGLKKRNLNKHKKDALKFIKSVYREEYISDLAKQYQKRFIKNENKLFTFLYYDGIPWNNNNAEHAIKYFAKFRRIGNGLFTERTIKQYLIILSILQTCEYSKINTLKFMLSKKNEL